MMLLALGALSAALAIGAGAFGAHGAASPQAAEYLRLGGMYQLIHAVAVVRDPSYYVTDIQVRK